MSKSIASPCCQIFFGRALIVGGHVAAGASHQRSAEPVAGEAVDAEEGDRAVLDQARQALELVATLVEADRRGAQRQEGRGRERDGDDAAEHVPGHGHRSRGQPPLLRRAVACPAGQRRADAVGNPVRREEGDQDRHHDQGGHHRQRLRLDVDRREQRGRRRRRSPRWRPSPRAPNRGAGRRANAADRGRQQPERDRRVGAGDVAPDDPEVALGPDPERLAREHRRAEPARRRLHLPDLADEARELRRPRKRRRRRTSTTADDRARRWRCIAVRAPSRSIRRPPVQSSSTSQIGRASANQTSPGRL